MQVRRRHSASSLIAPAPVSLAGSNRVRASELRVVRAAIARLPAADRLLLAQHGLRVQLVAAASLEDGMWGATSVSRAANGRWVPTEIRVASRIAGTGVESLAEVVQHEIGHAISVLRKQDRSEVAAGDYARTH